MLTYFARRVRIPPVVGCPRGVIFKKRFSRDVYLVKTKRKNSQIKSKPHKKTPIKKVSKSVSPQKTDTSKKIQSSKKTAFGIKIASELCKQGCMICIDICPRKVFGISDKKDCSETTKAWVEATRLLDCTGCMDCEHMCPEFAIEVNPNN